MRIELVDPGNYPALRDYFLRLGGSVASEDGATLDVEFPDGLLDDDESAEMYFETWSRANHLDARVVASSNETSPASNGTLKVVGQASDPGAAPPPRLGDLLVRKGLVTDDQLSAALVESRQSGDVVGRVLIRRGWVFESELARVLAEQWSIPYVNLASVGVDRSCLVLMSPELGRRCAAVPVRFFGSDLRVAFADPSDPDIVAEVQSHLAAPIQPAIAELSDIDAIWRSIRS
jgi:Type II secretion system (T2SS), protein E, N-terminal domain